MVNKFQEDDRVVYTGNESFVGRVVAQSDRSVTVEGDEEIRRYDPNDLERYEDVVRAYEFEYYVGDRWIKMTETMHPETTPSLDEDEYRNVRELTYV